MTSFGHCSGGFMVEFLRFLMVWSSRVLRQNFCFLFFSDFEILDLCRLMCTRSYLACQIGGAAQRQRSGIGTFPDACSSLRSKQPQAATPQRGSVNCVPSAQLIWFLVAYSTRSSARKIVVVLLFHYGFLQESNNRPCV